VARVLNTRGQVLIRIDALEVVGHSGATVARLEGRHLVNLNGQELAQVDGDGFRTIGGADYRIEGDDLLGPSGSVLGTVLGGNPNERALAAAAYVEFYGDG